MNLLNTILTDLFRDKVKVGTKKLYPFHLHFVGIHIKELLVTGNTTIVKSGFLREIIYVMLQHLKIKYIPEIVGYIRKRDFCRWTGTKRALFFTPNMVLGYIKTGALQKDQMLEKKVKCGCGYNMSVEDIEILFDFTKEKSYSDSVKLKIIEKEMDHKWTLIDYCSYHKPIKQIIIETRFL